MVRRPNTLKIRLELKFIRKLQCARCTMARLNDNTSNMTKIAYNTYKKYRKIHRKSLARWYFGAWNRESSSHIVPNSRNTHRARYRNNIVKSQVQFIDKGSINTNRLRWADHSPAGPLMARPSSTSLDDPDIQCPALVQCRALRLPHYVDRLPY